jgi:uncharacterized membrane-anchored protein YitT (DUF2179 family)
MRWSKLAADPLLMRRINGWGIVFWLLNLPFIVIMYLFLTTEQFVGFCLLYLALVSIYANVASHLSGWQTANTEAVLRPDIDVDIDVNITQDTEKDPDEKSPGSFSEEPFVNQRSTQ